MLRHTHLRGTLFAAALLSAPLAASSACSSGSSGGVGSFPATPLTTVTGDAGRLKVDVWTEPSQPPQRGTNSIKLAVTDAATGAPVDGLAVDVVPWMPAMGHGTSVTPTVSAQGAGTYVVANVAFFMAGRWELRTNFSGQVTDSVEPAFDVP